MNEKLQGVLNDTREDYYARFYIMHLKTENNPRTLCGCWTRGWAKPVSVIGASVICSRCERSAKKRGFKIPFAEGIT